MLAQPRISQEPVTRFVHVADGVELHTRQWSGDGQPFVLLHGLSSNSATWESVARRLAAEGHAVVTVDQRGHGLSDKPDSGYGFASMTADLASLIERLDLVRPIVAGQSWGGNVVLEFGARYPGTARGLALVDGGFLDLQGPSHDGRDTSWEATSQRLRPFPLDGMSKTDMEARIRAANPEWSDWGVEATLRNFEWLPDGSIRRWLKTEQHGQILRALWEQRPPQLYPRVHDPVLVCPADDGNSDWLETKKLQVRAAEEGLGRVDVRWFPDTHHDIHIHRPDALADLMLDAQKAGIWADG